MGAPEAILSRLRRTAIADAAAKLVKRMEAARVAGAEAKYDRIIRARRGIDDAQVRTIANEGIDEIARIGYGGGMPLSLRAQFVGAFRGFVRGDYGDFRKRVIRARELESRFVRLVEKEIDRLEKAESSGAIKIINKNAIRQMVIQDCAEPLSQLVFGKSYPEIRR